ncbi:MAG: hypothetical protein ACOC7X_11055 [Spirochaetota bacterium]
MNSKRQTNTLHRRPAALRAGRLLIALGTASLLLLFTASCSLATLGPDNHSGSINPQLSIMGLQADVNEVNINITGQDYQRSVTVTPSSSNLEFFLPPGDDVKFEIEAENQDSATSHVYTWGMTRFTDLVQGETAELDFVMAPKETKIFIPDYTGNKVVQMSGMNLSQEIFGLSEADWLSNSTVGTDPFDIALDNQGRIWVSYSSGISMLNDLSVSEPSYSNGAVGSGIAFDHSNSILYFISDGQIGYFSVYRNTANIGDPQLLPNEQEVAYLNTFGIAVDHAGHLYAIGADQQERTTIFKIDPSRVSGNRVVDSYTDHNLLQSAADLLIKNNHLYITNPGGSDGELILKFTKTLELVDSFGTSSDGSLDEVGKFIQPARFITTTSDSIFVTDDDDSGLLGTNRIIKFYDTDGSGWDSYNPVSDSVDALGLFNIGL